MPPENPTIKLPPPPSTKDAPDIEVSAELLQEAERWERLTKESADGIIPIPEHVENDPNFDLGVAVDIGYAPEREKGMEDRVLARPDLGLYGVFDGVGASMRGDVAATLAAEHIAQVFAIAERSHHQFFEQGLPAFQAFCEKLAMSIHDLLTDYALARGSERIPHTCAAFVLLDPQFQPDGSQRCFVAHIGDCRVSQFQPDAGFSDITHDHHSLDEDEALPLSQLAIQRHPLKHFVAQSLGDVRQSVFTVQEVLLTPQTSLVLTTDGIHDVIAATEHDTTLAFPSDDVTLEDLARKHSSAQALATEAVQLVRRFNISRRAVDKKRTKVDNRAILVLKPLP